MKTWLEDRGILPAYGGGVIIGITLCFFGAATNTMAGWLYAICGTTSAVLILSIILPRRSLLPLKVRRLAIVPVSAGDDLSISLEIENTSNQPINLLEVTDILPIVLDQPKINPIEAIASKSCHRWTYYLPTSKRGVYQWQEVQLRTAAPLGLFWCRRCHQAAAKALVYPQILPLQQCPLIDSLGQEMEQKLENNRYYQRANQGLTRNLRQYRYGDSTRLIHWKTSARLGEFQIRELEVLTGGQEVIICLDTLCDWQEDSFERAIIAAASLYFYAHRRQLNVKLWTGETGLIQGERIILETLAGIEAKASQKNANLPNLPVIWLTSNFNSIEQLTPGSRWLFFLAADSRESPSLLIRQFSGLAIEPETSLQQQLQKPPR
ncbi:MAG: DUF58 domain-containing protein [Microcystis aeruginosa BK11-02]|nr:DUF58 domain-containing protein [Microcystis aeruginosa BK11-02]